MSAVTMKAVNRAKLEAAGEGRPEVDPKEKRSKRPPISGIPSIRPVCQWCGKKLRPWTEDTYEGGRWSGQMVARKWAGWRSYRGLFHSLGCALDFAAAAHKGGYRRVQ